MKDYTYGNYTSKEMQDILAGKSGSRRVKFRYEIIRNGTVYGELPVTEASVRYNKMAAIKRTARLTVGESDINWLTDYVKIWMLVQLPLDEAAGGNTWGDVGQYSWGKIALHTWGGLATGAFSKTRPPEKWAEFPLGVFVPSTVEKSYSTANSYSVEAYDLTAILQEDAVTERLFIEKGTNYAAAIESIIVSAGISQASITATTATLNTAREWDIGTPKLDIINELLREIDYETLSFSVGGIAVASPHVDPTADNVTITYKADELSVLHSAVSTDLDAFSLPNVFVGIVSNPDYTEDSGLPDSFTFTFVNNNPASPISTVNRGRNIVELIRPNDIASQEDLEKLVRRRAMEASQIYESSTVSTALMPTHTGAEVLSIQHPAVNGVFEEVAWEMPLRAGASMSHSIRRVVLV